MGKNNKGFTLVELLAVIVILGLLMAIAIPSVTKYITQSRVKTLISTMDSYITAVVTQVNDGEYKFSDSTKVFAIPIECISLEKGGQSPFGNWMQANEAYWAYVLVNYDSENYNYQYGFTFKDDAGYGLYPTLNGLITNNMVKTGYDDLNQPKDGKALEFVSIEKWEGFDNITADTELVVLEARSEGETGDGVETCTLCQKGDNYDKIEKEKEIAREEALKDYTLISTTKNSKIAFWNYRYQIKTITFENSINIPNGITDEYKWDVSLTGNGKVMAYITPNTSNSSYYDLYIQGDGQLYASPNSSYWFYAFRQLDIINNIEIFDTSRVTDMSYMFYTTGYDNKNFTLDLGNNFDTSNVTNMSNMFHHTGYSSTIFTLDLGDKFDTSKVTDMSNMFQFTGNSSTVFTLDLGDKFDTSNVTNMQGMFSLTGTNSTKFTLDLGNRFNTHNVTNMKNMFYETGRYNPVFTLDLGDNFDTSKVANMNNMFYTTGENSKVFTLDLGNKFNTSNVTDMSYMFFYTGKYSPVFTLDLGNKFDTSNVTNMHAMFGSAGYSNPNFTLDLGDKFDTNNVTDMQCMFCSAGYSNPNFILDLGDKFDTSNVTDMREMFHRTGYSSTVFTLDLGDKFDTSSATTMHGMFFEVGKNSPVFTLNLGSNFNTENVADMRNMFYRTGYISSSFKLNCRNWNVDKVTQYSNFNTGVTSKVTPPTWVN